MNVSTVAAFDFDGTITYQDTLIPFLEYMQGKTQAMFNILREFPFLLGVPIGLVSRQYAKEKVLSHFLKGLPAEEVYRMGEEFAEGPLLHKINPLAINRLRWHQSQGHHCVLVSANLNPFLSPWAQKNQFQDLICSQLEVDAKGHMTGKLEGLNCYGPVKVKRLEALLGPRKNYVLYAYGDSKGDRELLAFADYPFYKKLE
jgi:phosphatidylglycerophosphatase C